jgi:RNA polymerase sigma-70 factor (ECF subfamily)
LKKDFIKECLSNDAKAQEKLYRLFAPKMYGICLRFAKNRMEAEDILQDGFIKIFTNLKYFRNEGSFEGWIRRTIINTAINHYKKNLRDLNNIAIEHVNITNKTDDDIISKLSVDELLELINELPDGYRIVFNLNVIEG